MTLLDYQIPGQARAADRLRDDPVIWLATTSRTGAPHAVPVWFWWGDPEILLFTRPDTAKVAHLRSRAEVALHLDTAADGGDVVLLRGRAALSGPDGPDDEAVRGFAAKYAPMLGGQPFVQWREMFPLPVVVTVESVIAWRATPEGLDQQVVGR